MAIGGRRIGAGRKPGGKNDTQRALLKDLFGLEVVPECREDIKSACVDIFKNGTIEQKLKLLQIIQSGEPKEITGQDGGGIKIDGLADTLTKIYAGKRS